MPIITDMPILESYSRMLSDSLLSAILVETHDGYQILMEHQQFYQVSLIKKTTGRQSHENAVLMFNDLLSMVIYKGSLRSLSGFNADSLSKPH